MFLLYVRLLNRDHKSASPQKNFCLSKHKTLHKKARKNTVEHLHRVESNHALERRLFL